LLPESILEALEKAGLAVECFVMEKEVKLKVVWEHVPDPDAAGRLLKAYEMLLAKAPQATAAQESVENHFDSGSLKNDHGRCQEGNLEEYIHVPAQ